MPSPADTLDALLPAGSDVYATIYVAAEHPSVIRPTGVLMATDRELGSGSSTLQPVLGTGTGSGSNVQGNAVPAANLCEVLGELCWTKYDLSFETTRPAFAGEQLTFQIQLIGARAWAFGHEGAHASKFAIVPGPMPASGLEFGVMIEEPSNGARVPTGTAVVAGGLFAFPDLGPDPTGAGDHPTTYRVEVSVDDASFGSPIEADLDFGTDTWSAPLGEQAGGSHTIHARATRDQMTSPVASSAFGVASDARIEWQIVKKNGAPDPAGWQTATGVEAWSFSFATSGYGNGQRTIVIRLVEDGLETARTTVRAKFQ